MGQIAGMRAPHGGIRELNAAAMPVDQGLTAMVAIGSARRSRTTKMIPLDSGPRAMDLG